VGWLIDTNLWIAVERGALAAADIHAITRQEPIYLSPINIAEIQFGLEMLPPGAKKQNAAAALRRLRRKPQLRITVEHDNRACAHECSSTGVLVSGSGRANVSLVPNPSAFGGGEMSRADRQASLKEAYGKLYAEASQLVREADPIRLIAIGAPDDEYDVEVSAILPRLREATSPSDVHRIVHEEFARWFGADTAGPPEIYAAVSEERSGGLGSGLRQGRTKAAPGDGHHEWFGEIVASRFGGRS
jgi:hypothetical protein